MRWFHAGIVHANGDIGRVCIVVPTFGSDWGLAIKILFCLTKMSLEDWIVSCCGFFDSPLPPVGLCEEGRGFDESYARSDL